MKILHLIHREDSPPLLRVQQRDAVLLADGYEVEVWSLGRGSVQTAHGEIPERGIADAIRRSGAEICHFYTALLPRIAILRTLPVPWVAPKGGSGGWFFLRREIEPDCRISPHPVLDAPRTLPEMVDPSYFEISERRTGATVGAVVTQRTQQHYEAVRARIIRFRDDVQWRTFSGLPSSREISELAGWVDLGVDPAAEESGVPESLVAGRAVIAPRNDLNRKRLLEGTAGFLVPAGDPNELAHVLLTALFKPEVAAQRIETALASRDRFRPAHRLRELESLYRDVIDSRDRHTR